MNQLPATTTSTSPAALTAGDHARIRAALDAAESPHTRRAYIAGWERWQDWAIARGAATMPAAPDTVSAYFAERAESVSVATVRMDRAAIAAAHRATGAADPCRHEAVRRVLKGIGRQRKVSGRGQVQGLDWRAADLAAGIAANGGGSVAGIRDAALIATMSDALLRVSEAAALAVDDVQIQADGSGTLLVRRSKTDQEGRGHVRYLGAPTMEAITRWQVASGIVDGRLFRAVSKGDGIGAQIGTRSLRAIIAKRARAAGITGHVSGHSLRVGSAQSLAAAGAGRVELQQAGDWQAPTMPAALRASPARRPRRRRQAPLLRAVGAAQRGARSACTSSGQGRAAAVLRVSIAPPGQQTC